MWILQAKIRVGGTVNFAFNITEPEVYPVDLYYLMDTSYSMRKDLKNLKTLAASIGGDLPKHEVMILKDTSRDEALLKNF